MPTRSAWPGRGRVRGALRATPSSSSAGTGSGDMTFSHLGHSVLPTSMATGPPRVRPCRMPPMMETSSFSNFMRAPRPYPARRRSSAAAMSSEVTDTPAGRPSTIATSAGPWDSPAVSQRNMVPIFSRPAPNGDIGLTPWPLPLRDRGGRGRALAEEERERVAQEEHGERAADHERSEGELGLASGASQQDEDQAHARGEQEGGEGPADRGPRAVPAQVEADQAGEFDVAPAHAGRVDEPQQPVEGP